jgi:cyclic pyranopterin phosphate synthase
MIYAFEGIEVSLPYMPLAARRALDGVGRKLSLDGWLSLSLSDREALVLAGSAEAVDAETAAGVLARAVPLALAIEPSPDPPADAPPPALSTALGAARPLDAASWQALAPLARYALAKSAGKAEKLAAAYDELVAPRFAHLGDGGEARMVDVGAKAPSARRAVATARVRTTPAVLDALASSSVPKGDVFAAARIAGIMAAKRTPELIPLCHGIALTRVEVSFAVERAESAIDIWATAEAVDRTGVEMEAMVAASVAALTIYDMLKSADRWMTIEEVKLVEKRGGKSGDVTRPER